MMTRELIPCASHSRTIVIRDVTRLRTWHSTWRRVLRPLCVRCERLTSKSWWTAVRYARTSSPMNVPNFHHVGCWLPSATQRRTLWPLRGDGWRRRAMSGKVTTNSKQAAFHVHLWCWHLLASANDNVPDEQAGVHTMNYGHSRTGAGDWTDRDCHHFYLFSKLFYMYDNMMRALGDTGGAATDAGFASEICKLKFIICMRALLWIWHVDCWEMQQL